MTLFNKMNQSVCFQCLKLQSVLIFLTSTYLVIRTHLCNAGIHRAECGKLWRGGGDGGIRTVVNRANWQLWNGVTGVEYCDGGGGILHIAELSKCVECMTWYIQVKVSDNCNTGVVRLLYQYYAHIPWKHNSIYNSVHIKHDGWQLQELLTSSL